MKKLRTAIYVRQSTGRQRPTSIDDQAAVYAELAVRHGGAVVDNYVDTDGGGHRGDRPGLMRLIDDVRLGKVDMILTDALDRLACDSGDNARIADVLRLGQIRLVTSAEGEIDETRFAVGAFLDPIPRTRSGRSRSPALRNGVAHPGGAGRETCVEKPR